MNKRSTIFIAEVVAITKGIQKYEEKDTKKDNILILTDSMSAIKNIENNEITTYKNTYIMEARKRIYEIKKRKNRKVILAWIPAHIGITGNEIVDHLAKQGTEEDWTKELKIPYGDLKEEYKKEARERTKEKNLMESGWKGKEYFKKYDKDTENS